MNARFDPAPHRWRSEGPLEDIDVTRARLRRQRDASDKLWIGTSIGVSVVAIVLFIYLGV